MSQKYSAVSAAAAYAAKSAAQRDEVQERERNEILALSYLNGKYIPAVGRDVMRKAQILWLARHPFSDPDRIGRYASLILADQPSSAVILCLFDDKKYLLETHLLASGPLQKPEKYGVLIPDLFKKAGASHLSVIFTPRAGDCGYTWEDENLATRLTIYCRQQGLSVLDCTVAGADSYISLYRTFGYTP